MTRFRRRLLALCAFMALTALTVPVRAACTTGKLATIPLTVTPGAITLPVQVNGQTATFIVDTGAQRSVVTDAAVQRLGLARDQWVGTTMGGIGGIESRPNADPRSLTLGGVPLVRRTLNHDTSLTVGVLPRTRVGGATIDGLLGRDFLSVFDLDLDMLGHTLTLYRVQDCAGRFLPWGGDYIALPVTMIAQNAVILPVSVDGTTMRALLDTGASSSLIAAPGMFRLGLNPASLAADPGDTIAGVGPRVVVMRRHSFDTLTVAGTATDKPAIWVGPVHLAPIVDMLLGDDWLAGKRLWISFATHQMFVATP